MDHHEVTPELESTFLPFRGGGARFHNFALLTELLGYIAAGVEVEWLLEFIRESVLDTVEIQDLYLLRHTDGLTWRASRVNSQPDQQPDHEVILPPNHAISASLESGAIGISSTDGWLFGLEEDPPTLVSDTYRLLIIPLIDNLVPRSVIVAVIANPIRLISPAEQELIAFLQAIISYVAYGAKPLDPANYDF